MAFAVLAAVGMVAVQTARAEPGPSAVFHGRTDARVRFTGDWMPVVAPDKTLGRYAERSDAKGASVELDFCGTTVGLVHQAGGLGWEWGVILPETGRALGLAEVRIDGGAPVVIDTSRGGRTLLAKGLPAGRHRVTVTNLGGIGGTAFTPIVNYPEVAILGMARNKEQPVVRDGQLATRLILPLCLSYDHRIINGADGARFIRKLASLLEDPEMLLLEA